MFSLHVTFCRIDQFSSRLDTIKDDFKESRKKKGEKKSHKNAADVKLVMTLYFSLILFDLNHDAIYTGIQYQMGFEC